MDMNLRLEYCPICDEKIKRDNGYGSMEIYDACPIDWNHYSFFMNIYTANASVLGEEYLLEQAEGRKKWKERVLSEGWE